MAQETLLPTGRFRGCSSFSICSIPFCKSIRSQRLSRKHCFSLYASYAFMLLCSNQKSFIPKNCLCLVISSWSNFSPQRRQSDVPAIFNHLLRHPNLVITQKVTSCQLLATSYCTCLQRQCILLDPSHSRSQI